MRAWGRAVTRNRMDPGHSMPSTRRCDTTRARDSICINVTPTYFLMLATSGSGVHVGLGLNLGFGLWLQFILSAARHMHFTSSCGASPPITMSFSCAELPRPSFPAAAHSALGIPAVHADLFLVLVSATRSAASQHGHSSFRPSIARRYPGILSESRITAGIVEVASNSSVERRRRARG